VYHAPSVTNFFKLTCATSVLSIGIFTGWQCMWFTEGLKAHVADMTAVAAAVAA
jgi:hypothetical protein